MQGSFSREFLAETSKIIDRPFFQHDKSCEDGSLHDGRGAVVNCLAADSQWLSKLHCEGCWELRDKTDSSD